MSHMNSDTILGLLRNYRHDVELILSRFTRSRDSISIDTEDNFRFRTIVTELVDLLKDHIPRSNAHIRMILTYYNQGIANFVGTSSYASVKEIIGAISAVITRLERNPQLLELGNSSIAFRQDESRLLDALDQIISRFHVVAVQMRSRYEDRPTLEVEDEYDVQNLMHALLRLYFDDVRPEESVPSYAGNASRTDFLLPQIDTVIETKKTREGMTKKTLVDQLIVDIARYKKHPQCRRLVCFVYDPEGRITNPDGIEADLASNQQGIEVIVNILPKLG